MTATKFSPDSDIPDLSGKVIFITGGTAGLGRMSVLTLAKHNPEHIYFSGRNKTTAKALIDEVKAANPNQTITFLECDLTSFASVENAAQQFTSQSSRLDILMCNAGIMATPAGVTRDGYEIQFGTNHLGHALLIKLLLPTLLKTAETPNSDVRIVSNTSLGFKLPPAGGIVFQDLHGPQDLGFGGRWKRYAQSKLANIVYTAALAERYPSITSLVVHPGVIKTDLVSSLGFWDRALVTVTNINNTLTPEEGVHSQLYAATAPKEKLVNGGFYEPVGVLGGHTEYSKSEGLRKELWEWTQKQFEEHHV